MVGRLDSLCELNRTRRLSAFFAPFPKRRRLIHLTPQRVELAAVEYHISEILFMNDLKIGESVTVP